MTEPQIDEIQRLRASGQYTQALAMLHDWHRADPSNARVNYELACTYDPQGLEEDAIPFYERALELGLEGPALRGCLLGLGSSYRCVERYGDALRTLQKGAAAFPDAKEFDVFLALARYNTGEHAEAMRLLLNHIAEFSADPETAALKRAIAFYAEHLSPPYNE
ncbi:MAG: tetratricopeptide repeat protein [Burkholderiales bacterium]|jgi:tetratricopeptide (TPR) repeat protein